MRALEGSRVVLVSPGGALGQAIAELAQHRGASVVCCQHSDVDRAGRTHPDEPAPVRGDFTDEDAVDTAFDSAADSLGSVDVLVNVVSLGQNGSPLLEGSEAEWHRSVSAPLRLSFLVVRRAVQEFLGAGGGRMVNVVDVHYPGPAATVATAALLSLNRCVAKEYGKRGVACNALVVDRADRSAGSATNGLRGVAATVAFLASAEAALVTGEELTATLSPSTVPRRNERESVLCPR